MTQYMECNDYTIIHHNDQCMFYLVSNIPVLESKHRWFSNQLIPSMHHHKIIFQLYAVNSSNLVTGFIFLQRLYVFPHTIVAFYTAVLHNRQTNLYTTDKLTFTQQTNKQTFTQQTNLYTANKLTFTQQTN